jgi:hypothetical protein
MWPAGQRRMLILIRTCTTAQWLAEKRWCECTDAPRCNSTTQTPPTIPAASASGHRRRFFARGLGRSGMRAPAVAQKIGRPACVRCGRVRRRSLRKTPFGPFDPALRDLRMNRAGARFGEWRSQEGELRMLRVLACRIEVAGQDWGIREIWIGEDSKSSETWRDLVRRIAGRSFRR